ncbi:helix-turn-helix domain-containing protein [Streptomyces sp. TLI_171]|uniref:winged helix-turn-helix transcriptional regulator n=1 Tax=Streptomyces sp. TLI_171 TaxID=1938859 RepID=UPI000C1991B8|nr:helix-turn-helix domain-containing protein [Streptomyces sp. TLI_171]RKE17515.1 HxlR family transcriptional regulator [Streptomyces sp. TLI_171]
MTGKRSYEDGCGVAHALELVGERWALLVVRDLLLGPKRFTDLQAGLPAAGPNVLTQRLRDLERAGVVRRRTLPPPAGSKVYELTDWGAELGPLVEGLGRWGSRSPVIPRSGPVRADSLLLGLRATFAADPAPDWTADYEVRLDPDRFTVRVVEGRLVSVTRGQPPAPAAVLAADPAALDAVLSGRTTPEAAVADGSLTIDGDVPAALRLLHSALA